MDSLLPPIPAKRYFTIGEVGELCGVKPHVLRYWEQEFTQLRPVKRRGNRRYYQHHEVLMIRRIRDLLYDQGFTISGARNRLQELVQSDRAGRSQEQIEEGADEETMLAPELTGTAAVQPFVLPLGWGQLNSGGHSLYQELVEIRDMLTL
ncbi:MerR family transcriptional regulator [Limnohabitans sp. DCL3]|uniref:MerR family transcriptional regulator n=1 Tax=Limnohabitans sp. DCL3 TaxID=3374103 RepID=UPI003A83B030